MPDEVAGSDWTDAEVDLIVADYFDMHCRWLRGDPFVKAHRHFALEQLTGRSAKSVERKHQNISAVLVRLGMPWIQGYAPTPHFQRTLIDGVERFLAERPALFESPVAAVAPTGLAEPEGLFFEAPPTPGFDPTPAPLERIVKKFDPALRDARNRALGRRGEERIFLHEQSSLRAAGRGRSRARRALGVRGRRRRRRLRHPVLRPCGARAADRGQDDGRAEHDSVLPLRERARLHRGTAGRFPHRAALRLRAPAPRLRTRAAAGQMHDAAPGDVRAEF